MNVDNPYKNFLGPSVIRTFENWAPALIVGIAGSIVRFWAGMGIGVLVGGGGYFVVKGQWRCVLKWDCILMTGLTLTRLHFSIELLAGVLIFFFALRLGL